MSNLATAIEFLNAVKHSSEGYYAHWDDASSQYWVVSLANLAELGRRAADSDDFAKVYELWCGETESSTTAELLTDDQLRRLCSEAGAAGDTELSATATNALEGCPRARQTCDEVITGELFRSAE